MGVYYYDELGGIYINCKWNEPMLFPRNMSLADLTCDIVAKPYAWLFQMNDGFGFLEAKKEKISFLRLFLYG
ncbi:MAG: hypothetical protein WHU54_00020 [Candidatus Bathyarchaeia archaeon]